MDRAIKAWIEEIPSIVTVEDIPSLRFSYTIYGCMLLLAHNAFDKPQWQELRDECTDEGLETLYRQLCKHLNVSHIAINKPIPRLISNTAEKNFIRAPQNFTPLHGNFGPETCSSPPTRQDFDAAFWVTAKQNGIYQSWAPRWTMFSRGNISEKARLLDLPSVLDGVEQGKNDGRGCAAVDLYAGVGYFAFSYVKAGMDRVLCWEINPWSIEGLRRGALANKWASASCEHDFDNWQHTPLLVFSESNVHAGSRVDRMRDSLPPIRHVNCGLLPTSRGSWQTAIDVLDKELGGWVHVHENFGVMEIEEKAEEVRTAFQHMVQGETRVQLEYIHKLKSYAPGVMHCVIDIHIPPYGSPV